MKDNINNMDDNINPNAKALQKKVTRLKRRREKLDTEILDTINEMQKICIHDDIEIKNAYINGGYLNKEEYHTVRVCKICGEIISN